VNGSGGEGGGYEGEEEVVKVEREWRGC